MSSAYNNYLATVTFRPYLQPMPGLGTSARTGPAVILGGPRAGAGSAGRIYDYMKSTNQLDKILYSPQMIALREKNKLWFASGNGLKYGFNYYI
jgi:hypothetical protein